MKALSLLLFLLLNQQVHAEKIILHAPFTELEFDSNIVLGGRLVSPALVSTDRYFETIQKDCTQFESTMTKYGSSLNAAELVGIVRAPVALSMKDSFEVSLEFSSLLQLEVEGASLKLELDAQRPMSIQIVDADLLKDALKLNESYRIANRSQVVELTFLRRDIFCKFLNEKAKLSLAFKSYFQPSEQQHQVIIKNLRLLMDEVEKDISSQIGDRLAAATIGVTVSKLIYNPQFSAATKYKSVGYLWDLLFEGEDSLNKSNIWGNPEQQLYPQVDLQVELRGVR